MNTKFLAVAACGLFGLGTAIAQPTLVEKVEAKPDKIVIPYEKWKLPNGLTIILHEDHSDPVVSIMVTYKVGSNRESLGKSGFAHFFEHMMFQGSKHVADEEHFKMVSNAGGNMNGNTTRDRTVYYETLPSNYLELGLWLESDRMGFLLDSLTTKKFENQRDAVKNEKRQNVENVPYAMAYVEEINKTLYPYGHPYSWSTIGYMDDLNRATVEDVRSFFLRWYGPNNAILTISGDFTPTEVLPMIDKYFGNLKQCPEVKKMRVPQVVIGSDKYSAPYKDNIILPLNLRVYPTVPQYHRDEPALDLLAIMMGGGNNSIFYKNFVKSKFAYQAGVSHASDELSGEFTIDIIADAPEDFNYEKMFTTVDEKVKATIEEFGTTGITDEALQRAKGQLESRIYGIMGTTLGKAYILSDWERLIGRQYSISDEIDRYGRVTKDDISRVFNKYVKGTGAAILNTYPIIDEKDSVKSVNPYAGQVFPPNPEYNGLTYTPIPDKFDRSARPKPGASKTVKVPEFYNSKLENGLIITGTKTNETPEVNINISIDGGVLLLGEDKLKKLGIQELTAGILNEGTKNFTTEQISAELDKLGSSIDFLPGKTANVINVSCLRKNLDATLKLLEEKLLNPGFREEDFKLVKKQYKENLKNLKVNSSYQASIMFNYALYGDNVFGLAPSMKSVDNVQLTDLKEYFEKAYTPSNANIVVVGDVDEKEMLGKLAFLKNWQAKTVVVPAAPQPVATTEPRFFIFNKSLAPSSVIQMGFPSLKYDATGDYFKNQIANFVFGGNFNSRINLNLREQKGYTYGIYSNFSGGKYHGTFAIGTSVKRAATALSLAEILKEFKKYEASGITDEELEFTKNSLLNQEALRYEAPEQKLAFLSGMARFNLEKDYPTKQNQILKSITKDEVNQQIKKYFNSNNLTTVVVGDKWIIESQIEKLSKDANNKEALNKVKLKKISID